MKKTLVIGASLNPSRYSNLAINRLSRAGHEVLAIGLKEGNVAGVTIKTTKVSFENVHTITLYLNPKRQVEYYDYIFSLAPKRVIFNPGTENAPFINELRSKNIEAEIACTLILLSTNQY